MMNPESIVMKRIQFKFLILISKCKINDFRYDTYVMYTLTVNNTPGAAGNKKSVKKTVNNLGFLFANNDFCYDKNG